MSSTVYSSFINDEDFSATKKLSRNSRRRDKLSRVWFMPSKVLNTREEMTTGRGRSGRRIGLEIFRQLSCKVCRRAFHKIQGLVFHCCEDHGHVNPSWSRRILNARFVLTDKLRVQDVTEFEEITDLETNVLREKRILPERPFSAKKMKKYNLVVVVRTVPEEIIHNITETDDSNSEDIEVVSDCPTSSSPTLLKETSCCRQQLPGQRLGAMDKVAAWLDAGGDERSSTASMSLSSLPDLAYTQQYGAAVRKQWKMLVLSGSFTPFQYPGVQGCKVPGCQEEFEDGLEAFMHIRDVHLKHKK